MFARYGRSGLALMGLPLYSGPLLAGWSAAPWPVPAAMAALFFLMQLVRGIDTGRSGVASVLALAAVQIAVVGATYGLGSLLALGTGTLALPIWLPLVLTLFGAVIGVLRYRRNPKEEQMWEVLDQAIDAVERGTPLDFGDDDFHAESRPDPEAEAAAQTALKALWALPDDAPLSRIDPIMQQLELQVGYRAYPSVLAEVDEGFRSVDLGMLRYLASPRVRAELVNTAELGFAVSLLLNSEDAGVQTELAALIATLLDEDAPVSELPDPEALAETARRFPVLAPLVAPVEEEYRKWPSALA